MELPFNSPGEYLTYTQNLIEVAVQRAMILKGVLSADMSKSEVYRTYGRGVVDRWIKEKLIKPIQDGPGKGRLDRTRLELLRTTPNRVTYLNSIERK